MQTSTASKTPLAPILQERLQAFLSPLLVRLEWLGRRLVKTFAATVEILLQNRYRSSGLLLSELGAFLTSPEHAPAGTKLLSNLLRSKRWSAEVLSEYLWERAEQRFAIWSAATTTCWSSGTRASGRSRSRSPWKGWAR